MSLASLMTVATVHLPYRVKGDTRHFIGSLETSMSARLGFYPESETFDSRLRHLQGARVQSGQPANRLDRCGEPAEWAEC